MSLYVSKTAFGRALRECMGEKCALFLCIGHSGGGTRAQTARQMAAGTDRHSDRKHDGASDKGATMGRLVQRRDNAIRHRSSTYCGQVEEFKRLDALLEYAVQHGAEAAHLREELKKLTETI